MSTPLEVDGAQAVVLRTVPWRDHDLIVDLLTPMGPVTLLARSARRSMRRFGGALDQGTHIQIEVGTTRQGRARLTSCNVLTPVMAVRADLDRIAHLNYVLEISRLVAQPESADPELFVMLLQYLAVLEQSTATAEALVAWELRVLAHLGYQLYLARCVGTGGQPNGLSLSSGGAVDAQLCPASDVVRVPPRAIEAMWGLTQGDVQVQFERVDVAEVRRALAVIWGAVLGKPLRTAAFLNMNLQ